ncbi:MAG: FtsH protease activity modulator HflK [Candidatus Rifleibacteriota bacterium]
MQDGNNKGPVEDAIIDTSKLPSPENMQKAIIGIVILALLVIGISSAFFKVDTEETAVVLRLGKFSRTADSGLHFKLPFGIERVSKVKTGRILKEEFGFRSVKPGIRSTYKKEGYRDESLLLTGDLNVTDVEWIVQFRIEDPFKYVFQIKNPLTTIRDVSEAITRKIVGDSNVTAVLTTERARLAAKIHEEMQKVLTDYDIGVKIVTVKFQDVNPPEKVKNAFNAVNEAEQQKESLIQQAREQYNREVPKTRGQAKQMIEEAEGYALQRVNEAEGNAKKFLALLKKYEQYPEVTHKRMYLETMERVLPRIKDIWIIDKEGKQAQDVMPILPLQGLNGGAR